MTARVTLEIVRGYGKGKTFDFDERAMCILGRSQDCHPRILVPKNKATISRHHCLLDINPPDICIRDFGSLNGTFVNKKKIGQRAKDDSPDGAQWTRSREVDLNDGDTIRVGQTVLRVDIFAPTFRESHAEQHSPIHATQNEQPEDGGRKTQTEQSTPPPLPPPLPSASAGVDGKSTVQLCSKCGRDVSDEVSDRCVGEYVCAACRSAPFELLKALLQQASSGDEQLVVIRGYRITKKLGQGGMGAVFLAKHEDTGQRVALKVMLPRVAADKHATEKFLRETTNTQALRHANVVRLYDAGCSRGTFFFTLELCTHGSVAQLIKRRGGKLSIDEAGPIILQALDGLSYAHSAVIPNVKLKDGNFVPGRGLVHRDIKPQNLLLQGSRTQRTTKVGDYGLAKAFDLAGLSGHTFSGAKEGTPHYMARQQVSDYGHVGPEVDVWAMAATLYNMLTGFVPRDFAKHKGKLDIWQIVLETEPIPIRQRDSKIPRKLADVIDFALRDKPEIGFKTARKLKQALMEVL